MAESAGEGDGPASPALVAGKVQVGEGGAGGGERVSDFDHAAGLERRVAEVQGGEARLGAEEVGDQRPALGAEGVVGEVEGAEGGGGLQATQKGSAAGRGAARRGHAETLHRAAVREEVADGGAAAFAAHVVEKVEHGERAVAGLACALEKKVADQLARLGADPVVA